MSIFHRFFAALRGRSASTPAGTGTAAGLSMLAVTASVLVSLTLIGAAAALWLLMKFMSISDRLALAIGRRFGLF